VADDKKKTKKTENIKDTASKAGRKTKAKTADSGTSPEKNTSSANGKKSRPGSKTKSASAYPGSSIQVTSPFEEADSEALSRGDKPMSIVAHLDEMRSRLIVSLITVIVITLVSFFFSEYIIDFLTRPYVKTGLKLNVFNLTEGFLLRLKASLIAGIIITLPVIIYEIWKYIVPAIEIKDRRFIGNSVFAAVFLLYLGILFTFFLILPFAIQMLLSFTPDDMTSTIGAGKYLSFVLLFCLAMGIMFELPILIMILTRIGIITPEILISKRKYALVLIWIVAAILTPPDVLTQMMLAIPVMLLYEISIIISKIIIKRKIKKTYEVK
jgi:sec-independent protein translocase protein TatC